MMAPFAITSTLLLAAFSLASPASRRAEADVIDPTVTSPTAGQVWPVNTTQTVTWDASIVPSDQQNATGMILLGFNQNNSENLDIKHPLATRFLLAAGQVNVTVPDVPTRSDYIVVLFGDSGNASPEFTIQNSN